MIRALRHLCLPTWSVRRRFPASAMEAITQAVRACEARHPGELRFVIEGALPLAELLRGTGARERALQVFSTLRVWDTEHNNGVLVYVLLADRDVEIVADRGLGPKVVDPAEWEQCCRVMEQRFGERRWLDGALAGIEAVAEVLRRHPPPRADVGNELPDAPALI